jgi:hypothetical protein
LVQHWPHRETYVASATCPLCQSVINYDALEDTLIAKLIELGATQMVWPADSELERQYYWPVFTTRDLFEWHEALQRDGWLERLVAGSN